APATAAVFPSKHPNNKPRKKFIEVTRCAVRSCEKGREDQCPSRPEWQTAPVTRRRVYFLYQEPSSCWSQTPAALFAAICLARERPTWSADAPVCFAIAAYTV